jgi:uncharacterized protein YjbJ (UPF0337 family)
MVNRQVLEGHWNEIKGKLRAHWAALSDDDLEQASGRIDQLVGVIQRKTGETRDTIENYLEEIVAESGGDMDEMSQTARDYARQAAETVQRAARDAGERAQYAVRQVRESMTDGYADAEELVRQRPVESLAVCFGAGLIAGVLVGLVLRR